jgi:adenosylmethionine-8-amino-7-oxononanoate aminotransferase
VIDRIEADDLLVHVRQVGDYMHARLDELYKFEIVGNVHGMGLLCGFEFVKDKANKTPFDPTLNISTLYQREALKRGLVQYACTGSVDGVAGDMILVAPPLVITEGQVDEMLGLIHQSLTATQAALMSKL